MTLAAPQDDDAFDGAGTVFHIVSGGGYDGETYFPLEVTIVDDDEAGLAVNPAALTIDEGSTAPYTVALKTRPSGKRPGSGCFVPPTASTSDRT